MKKNIDKQMVEILERDNHKLREAGLNLAKSAINVVENYDGVHRLSREIANWFLAISNQGDRDEN